MASDRQSLMKRFLYLLLSLIACLCVWCPPVIAQGISPEAADSLEAQVLGLSFDELPAFEQGGFMLGYRDAVFQAEGQAGLNDFDEQAEQYNIPYDPAREWIAGQFPREVIEVGDLMYTGMGTEQLTMDTIGQLTGLDIENFQLADIPFLQDFTLSDLVGDVPFLGDYALTDLPNLAEQIGGAGSEDMLSQYLSNNPGIAQMSVGDSSLGSLQVSDVPNLGATKLGEMPEVGDDTVANVPGLSVMQFANFPGLEEMAGGMIPLAKQDISFGEKEYSSGKATPKPVSGGTNGKEGWEPIACVGGCAHIELYDADISPFKGGWAGSSWMTNQHRVKDGFGVLGAVFNEAGAYRVPFGPTFALQVTGTEEKTGAADWGLAFRVCKRSPIDLGCTAYFMEVPLPITTNEGATILTGVKDGLGGSTQPIKAPEGWEELRPDAPPELQGMIGSPAGGLCGKGPGGVNYEALAKAFASIEGDYGSVGSFTDGGLGGQGQRLEGRGLGRYQYMSYREDVRAAISQQPGGEEFLARVDRAENITSADIEKFFPPELQDEIFKKDQEVLINKAISEGAEGRRVIERVGQMHFTGKNGEADGQGSDMHGRLSIEQYGKEFANTYLASIEDSDSDCGKATGKFINPNPKGVFTSGFGGRVNPVSGVYKMHDGIDLASPTGQPGAAILATDGGVIIYAGGKGGYGNYVEIDHGGGTKSWYGHLTSVAVKVGDSVKQGDTIGSEGTTGNSTGVHLHFGLEVGGQLVDPAKYIPL